MLEIVIGGAFSLVLLLLGWIKSDVSNIGRKMDAHVEAHAKGEFKGGLKEPASIHGPGGY